MHKKYNIIIATNNPGKIREIKRLLKALPFSIRTLNDLPNVPRIVEDGKTFDANARKLRCGPFCRIDRSGFRLISKKLNAGLLNENKPLLAL